MVVVKLKDLVSQKRVVESEIAERQEELQALEVLINRQRLREGLPPEPGSLLVSTSNNGDGERQRRVRGTLKAAKQAVFGFVIDFTRADLFQRIEADNPTLVGKISPEAQRSTMRTLVADGYMEPTEENSEDGEALYRNLRKL